MHPTAKVISIFEMRIIGGKGAEMAMAFVQHLIEQIKSFATVTLNSTAMVVDFNCMGKRKRAAIFDGEL